MAPRIALFLPNLAGGGAERMFLHLSRGFVEQGYDTDLVLSRMEGPYLEEVPDSVRVVELDAGKMPGYGALGSVRPLREYLNKTCPSALLSAMARVNVVAILAAHLARTSPRVVVSERNHLSSYVAQTDEFGIRSLPWLVRLAYPHADEIIPISEGVADDLTTTANLDRDRMSVIYNPVVTPEITAKASKPIDHEWFRDPNLEVVLGVGSLSTQKDFPTLVRAVARVREELDTKLVVLGEGNQRETVRKAAESAEITDHVHLPGFKPNPYAYMAQADLFALSSRWEGFGNVLVEAMACGTPVVSTDCPSGPAEILCDGEFGPLVQVGREDELADAILATIDNPPSSERLRRRADDFSYKIISKKYIRVLFPE